MDNMEIYNKVRQVPPKAKKPIQAGRLKGMTDINPMWRIKMLTEQFGPCGKGWYVKPLSNTTYSAEGEIVYVAEINLFVRDPDTGEWLEPIYGIGGSKLVSREKNGLYVDDEAPKKANTDALSVACKDLGMGADVYWDKDSDKYIDPKKENYNEQASTKRAPSNRNEQTVALSAKIKAYADEHKMTMAEIARDYKLTNANATAERLQEVYDDLTKGSTADSKPSTPPSHPSTEPEQTSMADEFAELDEKLPF